MNKKESDTLIIIGANLIFTYMIISSVMIGTSAIIKPIFKNYLFRNYFQSKFYKDYEFFNNKNYSSKKN